MKTIIVGATGFIGSSILQRALQTPQITSIITLSRRPLPDSLATAPQLKNILVADFASYPPELLRELEGAELCIWAMGGRVPQFPDLETARKVNVEYLHAGAGALAAHVAPKAAAVRESGRRFRFVYCSGMFTEYDQDRKLWFLEESRKLKGAAESGLLEIEKEHGDRFEVFVARPAGVLETDKGLQNIMFGSMGIGKGELAAAIMDIAVSGAKQRITESLDLRRRGKEVLKQK